jgi:hypothetical protein
VPRPHVGEGSPHRERQGHGEKDAPAGEERQEEDGAAQKRRP